MSRRWTLKEIELFGRGLSDREIARKTGRTLKAIQTKKTHIKAGDLVYEKEYPVHYNPYRDLTELQKIDRINNLKEKYGVKLKGGV